MDTVINITLLLDLPFRMVLILLLNLVFGKRFFFTDFSIISITLIDLLVILQSSAATWI